MLLYARWFVRGLSVILKVTDRLGCLAALVLEHAILDLRFDFKPMSGVELT